MLRKLLALSIVLLPGSPVYALTENASPAPPVCVRIGATGCRDLFALAAPARELQLSWRGVLWNSERVRLDGQLLVPGRDYEIDCESGVLRLPAGTGGAAALEVIYHLRP